MNIQKQIKQIRHIQNSMAKVRIDCNTCKKSFEGLGKDGVDFIEEHPSHKTWVSYVPKESKSENP